MPAHHAPRAAARQKPSSMPYGKYTPFADRVPVRRVEERQWIDRPLDSAPLWCSVDLRDGNQALAQPMAPHQKTAFFDLLVGVGFKDIEVGYPAASAADLGFVRRLATVGQVPADVVPSVFTAIRPDLIQRTFDAVQGMAQVTVHLCNATAPLWRERVLRMELSALERAVTEAARTARALAARHEGEIGFEYSPEVFNATEPEVALRICELAVELLGGDSKRPVIVNLPATVEAASPDVFADQVEWFHENLQDRSAVVLSVHGHNDRGTAVAATELALRAGAERVEGCLFGNGERTGNVCLTTLALNLFSQGVDPMLELGDLAGIERTYEECTGVRIPERHPYVGRLVHTAFSGTHQDAINKALDWREHTGEISWNIPYLPVDPRDLGRDYDEIIRINAQSGKGGISYLLRVELGMVLPQRCLVDFSRAVQAWADTTGGEVTADDLWKLFGQRYIRSDGIAVPVDVTVGVGEDGRGTCLQARMPTGSTARRVVAESLPAALGSWASEVLGRGVMVREAEEVRGPDGEEIGLVEVGDGRQWQWSAAMCGASAPARYLAAVLAGLA